MDDYQGPERRIAHLSSSQIDEIAEKAAEKALEKVYAEVGQAVLKKLAWVIGVCVLGVFMWLTAKGVIK